MLRRLLLAVLVGLGFAAPAATWAASGGGHVTAPRSLALQGRSQIPARHERSGFAGLGASGVYSTLLSGTFESPAPDTENGLVVPPPPFCYPPMAPPHRCVRPVLIHLMPSRPVKNLPRVVYGTPFQCAG
jgi:hypothetical protein